MNHKNINIILLIGSTSSDIYIFVILLFLYLEIEGTPLHYRGLIFASTKGIGLSGQKKHGIQRKSHE